MKRKLRPGEQTFIDMIFNGIWRIQTRDGEYLDVIDDGNGGQKLVTHPVSRVRHDFRIRSFEELERNRWGVWAEPFKLSDQAGPITGSRRPGNQIYPFVLVYDGCNNFVLEELPAEHMLRQNPGDTMLQSLEAVSTLSSEQLTGLPVELDAFRFISTVSGVNFPVFSGDQQRAFSYIAGRLGFDPHSSLLTLAALANIARPDDIPQDAWDAVLTQLRVEIDYRQLAGNYFSSIQSFVQNVFISNAGLVDNVGAIVGLDKSNVIQLLLNAALQSIAGAVGGLKFTGAGVVSGALKVLFQQLAADKGPSVGNFNVALAEARTKVSELFDDMITAIQNWRIDVYNDWGKLETMGLNIKSGEVAWPANDEEMRKEAKKQLEISLYKDLTKVRWNHMRSSKGTYFSQRGDWTSYMEKNKNYWVEAVPTTQTDLFGKEKSGYNVTMHWLGRGSTIFDHKEPDDRLPIRIFNELGVSRPTVFREWGLAPQTFFVNY